MLSTPLTFEPWLISLQANHYTSSLIAFSTAI